MTRGGSICPEGTGSGEGTRGHLLRTWGAPASPNKLSPGGAWQPRAGPLRPYHCVRASVSARLHPASTLVSLYLVPQPSGKRQVGGPACSQSSTGMTQKLGQRERVGGPDREEEVGGGAGRPGVQERAVSRLAASGSGLNGSREWSVCVCGHREW